MFSVKIAKTYYKGNKEKLEKASLILKIVAHPIRLAIVDLLNQHNEMAVNEICELLDCEQSMISHHLINMKLRGILQSNKMGLKVMYSLKVKEITKLIACIENCECNM